MADVEPVCFSGSCGALQVVREKCVATPCAGGADYCCIWSWWRITLLILGILLLFGALAGCQWFSKKRQGDRQRRAMERRRGLERSSGEEQEKDQPLLEKEREGEEEGQNDVNPHQVKEEPNSSQATHKEERMTEDSHPIQNNSTKETTISHDETQEAAETYEKSGYSRSQREGEQAGEGGVQAGGEKAEEEEPEGGTLLPTVPLADEDIVVDIPAPEA